MIDADRRDSGLHRAKGHRRNVGEDFMRSTLRLWLAGATLVAVGCTDRPAAEPLAPTALTNVTSETSTELWRSIITGKTGPGSLYAIYVPRN